MATSAASVTKAITKSRTRCRGWLAGSTGRAGLSGSGRSAVRTASSSRVTAARAAVLRWSNSSRLIRPTAVCRSRARRTMSRSSSDARSAGSGMARAYSKRNSFDRSRRIRNAGSFVAADRGDGETMASGKQLIIERILRDCAGIWDQIIAERDLPKLILRMLLCCAISLAAYGAVLGASNGWLQALVSTVKLPLLFLVTLAICLPTLYLFNLVFGARLSVLQACALIMVAITVTAVLTFAFAPISLFFLITARSYAFFKLLNVAILILTALVGLRFLISGMRALNEHVVVESMVSNQVVAPAPLLQRELVSTAVGGAADPATQPFGNGAAPTASQNQIPNPNHLVPELEVGEAMASQPVADGRPASMILLYVWILLFGFVGTQLAWTLRPFFGSPRMPFELFRDLDGTFYADILRTLGSLLS